jgi:hypothetical protein
MSKKTLQADLAHYRKDIDKQLRMAQALLEELGEGGAEDITLLDLLDSLAVAGLKLEPFGRHNIASYAYMDVLTETLSE